MYVVECYKPQMTFDQAATVVQKWYRGYRTRKSAVTDLADEK